MIIAGRYELENTLGSQNEALPSQIYHLINNILENDGAFPLHGTVRFGTARYGTALHFHRSLVPL